MKIFVGFLICICIVGCNKKQDTRKFTLSGEIKNLPDQDIYLEQLYFSEKNPEVLDTAEIKNGKFELSAIAPEEGLFRIRMENSEGGFIFINDEKNIDFKADIKDVSLAGPTFNTGANKLLKNFLITLDTLGKTAEEATMRFETLKTTKNNDSAVAAEAANLTDLNNRYQHFIIQFIDTVSDPVVAMFALGYTRGIDPKQLSKAVPGLIQRFPDHTAVASLVAQYNQIMATPAPPPAAATGKPGIGSMAPDITMNDENGNPFSLSQLKGKYVLVDFWASWCGPCRQENPNVVEAFNKFKNKNFTILGVSLDADKNAWIKAIQDDKLAWKQISDLQQWNSAAVGLYGFDGIPYNVLVDPKGKIIATELRDQVLHSKLAEILK
jgi:peroxiredoxin